jgi:vancomycin resistance protein VanJ
LIAYLPLRALVGDRLWPVALMNTFAHWILLPAVALLPVMLWLRRWPMVVVMSVGAIVFLWLFGGLFLPQPSAATSGQDLTVMTYNVAHTFVDSDDLVAALRSSGADIIALEELTAEQARVIERDVIDLYPYQALYGYGIPGKGLLSRYPILEEELFYMQAQRLPHLRATITVDDVHPPITVIIAHPPPPGIGLGGYRIHPYAAAEITSLAQMTTADGPGILMGDLNQTDQNDNYALLSDAGLTDAFRAAGWGLGATWPARGIGPLRLLVRLDYIWYSNHFRAIRSWVGPDVGSDHLPVLAQLTWQTKVQD